MTKIYSCLYDKRRLIKTRSGKEYFCKTCARIFTLE